MTYMSNHFYFYNNMKSRVTISILLLSNYLKLIFLEAFMAFLRILFLLNIMQTDMGIFKGLGNKDGIGMGYRCPPQSLMGCPIWIWQGNPIASMKLESQLPPSPFLGPHEKAFVSPSIELVTSPRAPVSMLKLDEMGQQGGFVTNICRIKILMNV